MPGTVVVGTSRRIPVTIVSNEEKRRLEYKKEGESTDFFHRTFYALALAFIQQGLRLINPVLIRCLINLDNLQNQLKYQHNK